MAYNIKSTFTFKEPLPTDPARWAKHSESLKELLSQLVADGKTDGELVKDGNLIAFRYFSDRASAETWRAALSEYLINVVEFTAFTSIIEEITKTYSIMTMSIWANGRPTPEESVAQSEFLTIVAPLTQQGLVSKSFWPDENTTVRYFVDEASAQLYISAVADLNTKLNRNDWSYTIANGSITLTWVPDNGKWKLVCESPWIPAV